MVLFWIHIVYFVAAVVVIVIFCANDFFKFILKSLSFVFIFLLLALALALAVLILA